MKKLLLSIGSARPSPPQSPLQRQKSLMPDDVDGSFQSSAIPHVPPQTDPDKPHQEREQLVALLKAILSTEGGEAPKVKRRGSWLGTPSSSPTLFVPRFTGRVFSSRRVSGEHRFLSPSHAVEELTDDSNEASSSPRAGHAEREALVRLLGAMLSNRDSSEEAAEAEERPLRTYEDVRASFRAEGNDAFRERDEVVLCLMEPPRRRGSLVAPKTRSYGAFVLPAKAVRPFEDLMEQKFGARGVAGIFISLWDAEFARMVLAAGAGDEETERALYSHTLALMTSARLSSTMLNAEISREINAAMDNAAAARETLFRSASMATRIFSSLYHHGPAGSKFLNATAAPLVRAVMSNKQLLEPAELDKFKGYLGSFFNVLDLSLASGHLPGSMVLVLQHLNKEVSRHAGSMARPVLCVFMFVRFLCPVIVSPQAYNVARDAPNPVQQKNLILVSKLISNVASGVRFDGTKEDRMTPLNSLIDAYSPHVQTFLDKLVAVEEPLDAKEPHLSTGSRIKGTLFVRSNSDKMELCKSLEFLFDHVLGNRARLTLAEQDEIKLDSLEAGCNRN